MDQSDLVKLLVEKGAILHGHFQFSSGRHGDTYVEKFRILQWPDVTAKLCEQLAAHFQRGVNLVAGPTTGGVVLSFEMARQLGIRSIIAEKGDKIGVREFKRGFEIGPGDLVLVIDDVLTTGGSIREVINAVEERGATVVGVAVLIDRTGGRATFFGILFAAAITLDIVSWAPADCPLCVEGVPIIIT